MKTSRDHLLLRDKCRLLLRPWSSSPSKTRFWKNSNAGRQDTVLKKRTRRIPAPSNEIRRDWRVVTPRADWSDKM